MMAMHLDDEREKRRRQIEHFAKTEAASSLDGTDVFPVALWRKMGEAGLLGLGIPAAYGGSGGDWLSIQAAGEAFVRGGCNMGMALSWLIHLIVCRFAVLGCGTNRQIEQWLPRLAAGEITLSLAISEPGTGAHPKYMRTSAFRDGDDWILTGEKSFLTNGPLAGLFVVLAVSATEGGKKQMTAFLIPRKTPGLSLTDPFHLDFLKPSPHCGIRLDACRISSDQMLGSQGDAFERISKPFRDLEDVMLMGPVTGAMQVQMTVLPVLMAKQEIGPTDDLKMLLGELQFRLDAMRILAYESAAMLDSGCRHPEFPSLLLSFRSLAGQFQSRLAQVIDQSGIKTDAAWATLAKDLAMTIGMAGHVALIKQKKTGEAILLRKGQEHANHS
ncbi:MAG: acyl-CoA dehydrogenase family protein [Pseudomonadota bacterium]